MSGAPRKLVIAGTGVLLFMTGLTALSAWNDGRGASDMRERATAADALSEVAPTLLARRSLATTVSIRNIDVLGDRRSDGSGFFVTDDGLVATNLHVISGAYRLEVASLYGRPYDSVHFVAADPARDLAILKVFGALENPKPLELSRRDRPAIGERVYVTGNPHNQAGTFTDGMLSAHRAASGVTLLQISAPISSGSSGGPVTDASGRVIGVTSLRLSRGANLNYAVPVRYLRALLDSLPDPVRYVRSVHTATEALSGPVADYDAHQPGTFVDTTVDVITRQQRHADSSVAAANGYAHGELLRGTLAHGDSAIHRLQLSGGAEFVIGGFCDSDCQGLDLTIRAPDGRVLDLDVGNDDVPKVRFSPVTPGRHTIAVGMSHCDAKACGYGVRVYRMRR